MTTTNDGLRADVYAACSVQFIAGAPSYLWQSGEFDNLITDNGVGDVTLTLRADKGISLAQCAIICTPRTANTEVQLATAHDAAGPSNDSNRDKRIRIFDETGVGAAVDEDFDLLIVRQLIL